MKKITLLFFALLPSLLIGAANDIKITQRKADDSGFIERTISPQASSVLTFDASKLMTTTLLSDIGGGGGGSGTVTSFSAGDLSPLFTTSVATGTTTPALTFSLSDASQNYVFAGPGTGGTGAPTFRALVSADIPDLSGTYLTVSAAASTYTPQTRTISTTSPLSGGGDLSSNRTLTIADAAADGTTKGAASFTASDFDASSGNISIDYANGQTASGSTKGFLSSTDWTTFNGKQAAGNYVTALTGDVTASGPGSASATVTKINGTSLAGLATGILKNTTSTGVPSIALAADFPTLNQNTTGSAATLTTARSIYGNSFDGSSDLTQIIASAFGGTGNGFTQFTGPASIEKTFTLPNASATILTTNSAVTVPQGGTGAVSLTGLVKGNGTSAFTAATGGTDYEVPITFSTGLTRSTNTVTVNTTQNITKLSNLTSNGFVKTSGGDGTLSVDTTAYATEEGTTLAIASAIDSLSVVYQPLDAALTTLSGGSDFVQFTGPTSSTKTFTLPNASSTLATLTGTETLTNKTLTAPAISSPTGLVQADIGGLTTSDSPTFAGLENTPIGATTPSTAAFTTATALDGGSQYPLVTGPSTPIVLRVKNVSLLTTGSPADIATITVPSWCTRWVLAGSPGTTTFTGLAAVAETASGTLAGATVELRTAAAGGGSAVTASAAAMPATAGNASHFRVASGGPTFTASTVHVYQTSNSANAGTVSFYITIIPLL